MKYLITFRDRCKGGPVSSARFVDGEGLGSGSDLFGESRLVFLLHGFNRCQEEGRASLLGLADLLNAESTWGVVAVLWPGDHGLGKVSYSFEGRDADDTAALLARFIECSAPPVPVSFVAHSLGCRVALETVKRLRLENRAVEEVCLFAAAVDADSLASSEAYSEDARGAQRVTVLSSRRDKVLKFAYPVGDFLQAFLFRRDDFGLALGFRGPRDHKGGSVPDSVTGVEIPKSSGVGHGDYFPSPWREESEGYEEKRRRQLAAGSFAARVLAGDGMPKYGDD